MVRRIRPMRSRALQLFRDVDLRKWRALLRRDARFGLIALEACLDRNARLSAGAFCVAKGLYRLRLLTDRRVRNWRERLLAKAKLPSSSRFSRIILKGAHVMKLPGRDFKDFYFILGVDPSLFEKQAGGPRVPHSYFDDLDDDSFDVMSDFAPWWDPDVKSIDRNWTPPSRGFRFHSA